ncbi:MAG: DUF86 domain-containing protein [Ignavibacteriae bacterium]|nr:DUF86 domain-containing protein [Ignavibacteriota bacterium]
MNKVSIIEKCVNRIKEEYVGYEDIFEENYTKQDSVVLNLEMACQACIDLGMHIVRIKNLGVPQSNREVFVLLQKARIINPGLSKQMQAMVGFRNIAAHDYQNLNLDIVRAIIEKHLKDFKDFKKVISQKFCFKK